jgi:hypothetical protein
LQRDQVVIDSVFRILKKVFRALTRRLPLYDNSTGPSCLTNAELRRVCFWERFAEISALRTQEAVQHGGAGRLGSALERDRVRLSCLHF